MKLVPSYSRLIVEPLEKETKTSGGIHIPDSAYNTEVPQGTIIAVPDCYIAPNGPIKHGFEIGQQVYYKDNNVLELTIENVNYHVVHIDAVEAVMVAEAE